MINSNNIADLFNFIRNQKNSSHLSLKITKNNIDITNNKKNADLIVDNKNITINTKIDLILKQCEILIQFQQLQLPDLRLSLMDHLLV